MARRKQAVNFSVQPELASRFREASQNYLANLSLCFSAAMLMWLEADPEVQGAYLRKVFDAQTREDVSATIEAAKAEQMKRIKGREEREGPAKGKR